jgi:hypothetical protein
MLERLKEIIKFHFDIKIHHLININIITNPGTPPINYSADEGRLILNYGEISPEIRGDIGRLLPEAIENEDLLLIEDKSKERIEDIELKERSENERSLLSFFKGKIPHDDYTALRASLYLRQKFESGSDREIISRLKTDIISRYGRRGRNISDLCSAKYFENLIKPLYEEMKGYSDFTEKQFLDIYELIVEEGTLTVFVSEGRSRESIKQEVGSKIRRNKQYGIHFLYIHGIGRTNIETIRMVIYDLKEEYPFMKKNISEYSNIISVKLLF